MNFTLTRSIIEKAHMHIESMLESEGEFIKSGREESLLCPKCKRRTIFWKVWGSKCGGHEDEKYFCTAPDCGYYWWVDGPDA